MKRLFDQNLSPKLVGRLCDFFPGSSTSNYLMPRQNRVTPFGAIVAIQERGTLLRQSGCPARFGGANQERLGLKRWLLCVLEFKGRYRHVMTPALYELFFLDEATGLAAGHRPCAECQRARYNEYREAWATGNPHALNPSDSLPSRSMTCCMRTTGPGAPKRTWTAHLDELPTACSSRAGERAIARY